MTLKRYRVTDKAADLPEVYTTSKVGRTQSLTPEGFLLCEAVPIKRTGTMVYGPGEVPVNPGRDGVCYITRDEEALFSDTSIASYQGKPVVDDHPPEDVNPQNWKQFARGTVLNPRRGTGDDSDVLLADLLITDAETIRAVQSGKREVSAGYEADYEQTGEGEGRQTNIIGNHVALVAKGRCGPRCSISDHQPSALKGPQPMTTKTTRVPRRVKLADAVRRAFADAAENVGATLAEEMPDDADDDSDNGTGATHVHIHTNGGPASGDTPAKPVTPNNAGGDTDDGTMTQDDPVEARFQKLEAAINEIKQLVAGGSQGGNPGGTQDDDLNPDAGTEELLDGEGDTKPDMTAKTGDSAALATAFQQAVADAEILVPGFKVPTFDAALPRAKVIDNVCRMRRSVLSHLSMTTDGNTLLGQISDGNTTIDIPNASCVDVAATFKAAVALKRASNNRAATGDAKTPGTSLTPTSSAMSPAQMNKVNTEFWAARGVKN